MALLVEEHQICPRWTKTSSMCSSIRLPGRPLPGRTRSCFTSVVRLRMLSRVPPHIRTATPRTASTSMRSGCHTSGSATPRRRGRVRSTRLSVQPYQRGVYVNFLDRDDGEALPAAFRGGHIPAPAGAEGQHRSRRRLPFGSCHQAGAKPRRTCGTEGVSGEATTEPLARVNDDPPPRLR